MVREKRSPMSRPCRAPQSCIWRGGQLRVAERDLQHYCMGKSNTSVYAVLPGIGNSWFGESRLTAELYCRNLRLHLSWGLGCGTTDTPDLTQSLLQLADTCWSHRQWCSGADTLFPPKPEPRHLPAACASANSASRTTSERPSSV